jgi:hypothetical protein
VPAAATNAVDGDLTTSAALASRYPETARPGLRAAGASERKATTIDFVAASARYLRLTLTATHIMVHRSSRAAQLNTAPPPRQHPQTEDLGLRKSRPIGV